MNHLRLVTNEAPPKPRRRRGRRHCSDVLTPEEQTKARQVLRNMRDAFGTLGCMAHALGLPMHTLQRATSGRAPVSAAILVRAMQASGLGLKDLLGEPKLVGTCRACGAVRRAS